MTKAIFDALGPALADSIDAHSCHAVPPRYIRREALDEPIAPEAEAELPVIDFTKLADHHPSSREEAAKLHRACAEWGFFQLINHGFPEEVIEKVKSNAVEFFKFPSDEKAAVVQLPCGLEGYGQASVVSSDQKLDLGRHALPHRSTTPNEKDEILAYPTCFSFFLLGLILLFYPN